MTSPSYTPKFIPGSSVEYYSRRQDGLSFLTACEAMPELAALGYRYEGHGKHAEQPDGSEQIRIWMTARREIQKGNEYGPRPVITVEPDDRHHRFYANQALALILEAEVSKIEGERPHTTRSGFKRLNKAPDGGETFAFGNPQYSRQLTIVAAAIPKTRIPKHARVAVISNGTSPKPGSPDWKRLVRRLYREHTGKSAPSITKEIIGTLRSTGLLAG